MVVKFRLPQVGSASQHPWVQPGAMALRHTRPREVAQFSSFPVLSAGGSCVHCGQCRWENLARQRGHFLRPLEADSNRLDQLGARSLSHLVLGNVPSSRLRGAAIRLYMCYFQPAVCAHEHLSGPWPGRPSPPGSRAARVDWMAGAPEVTAINGDGGLDESY